MDLSLLGVARPGRADINVDRAPEIVAGFVKTVSGIEVLPLRRAAGRVLASEITSPAPVPLFDHSAVDGYAIRSGDAAMPETRLPVAGRILAGDRAGPAIERAAVRIMTGAPTPSGCDAVVKQEHVLLSEGLVTITDAVHAGANIRRAGEDVAAGDAIVPSGSVLDARHIALLAACGVARVPVARRVRVAIAAFGSEIRRPGSRLGPGQIFDANSAMATALFDRSCSRIVGCVQLADDRERAAALLRELSAEADLIVTSGGMAEGDEDHTIGAVEIAGGAWRQVAFAMKPGKPARLGRLDEAVVLGLPGNPFAALVALVLLGLPALNALAGARRSFEWLPARADFELERRPGRTEFFPARRTLADGIVAVERMGKGGSARLRPLVEADGLGRIEEQTDTVARGDQILFLPFASLFA